MGMIRSGETQRLYRCPECEAQTCVSPWCKRPVCVHSWEGNVPEVWDGDDADGDGRRIEESPNERYRVPGPDTWAEMMPVSTADVLQDLARNEGEWLEREYAEGRRVRRPNIEDR